MAKFNQTATIKTTNKEGHAAYGMRDKEKLVTQVLTSFFNEAKFYGDNSKEIQETVRRVIDADPAFVSKLAVFARREFNMRSVAHVLTAELAHAEKGKPFVRNTVKGVSLRGDDVTEIMACYLSTFGKPVPASLKKGISDVLLTFDEYTLAKYKGEKDAVKMRDLFRICRPTPKNAEQSALWKRCLDGTLAVPETWETELSANGNTKESWEKLIGGGKLGYMALLRNLRNIVQADPDNLQDALRRISDPAAVKKSRQLPFRFLSAYRSVSDLPNAGSSVLDALEDAADAAVSNLPKIPGKTAIAIDVSSSMSNRVSANSDIRCCDISTLLGLIAARICEDAIVYKFNTVIRKETVSHRTAILQVTANATCSGGTDMRLPFMQMLRDNIKADRIIILSDNQCNCGYGFSVQQLATVYRRETGNDLWVHAVDLQGYGTQQFSGPRTNIIAGWSEKVFDFILLAEQGEGSLEKRIAEYEW